MKIRTIEIALLVLSFSVFFLSPRYGATSDPKYSMLLSESLLMQQTPALNHFSIPGLDQTTLASQLDPRQYRRGVWQLVRVNGRLLYAYPSGSSLLSLPFVAGLNVLGLSAVRKDGSYNEIGEIWIQKIIACVLMAITTCVLFRTAALVLPISWSVVLAIAGAFGTQIWSIASRGLWSHTWEVFLATWVIYILLSVEEGRLRLRATLLASIASWMCFVRPTAALDVIAISGFMFLFHPGRFLAWTATVLFWLAAFVTYSFSTYVPGYYHLTSLFSPSGMLAALAAILVSPSRGLIIFVPVTIMVVFLVAFHWRHLPHRRLGVLAMVIILAEIFTVSFWPFWWGGETFGPRLLTDTIPWFFLLAILGCAALLKDYATQPSQLNRAIYKNGLVGLGLVLICVSVAINGIGAISREAQFWNVREDINAHPERVWDWHHPQFLATISRADWIPSHFAELEKRDSAGASPVKK